MDTATIQRLNAINRTFYATTALEFDQTRGQPWQGWLRLPEYLNTQAPVRVLDVGCGNGRLGVFLAAHLAPEWHYHGLDSNATLLEQAHTSLSALGINFTLAEQDILEDALPSGEYACVALFGVLHHIPSAARRVQFLQALAERVAVGGILAFAAWRFYEYERFRNRIVPWPADIQAETGDYLLDWRRGETAVRYCHYVDDAEQARLIAATGLEHLITYRADGFSGAVNAYSILRR